MATIYQHDNVTFPVDNIFNIEQPELYTCIIGHYQASLSRLEVIVAAELGFEIIYKIVFNGVTYLDTPTRWKGANFSVAPPETCVELVHRFDMYRPLTADEVLDQFVLYTVVTKDFQSRILAASGTLFRQDH